MGKRLWSATLGFLAAAGLGVGPGAGPGAGAARADEIYMIHGGVWDYYQSYLDKIGHGLRPGAFVITPDGLGAMYRWCPETRCRANMNLQTQTLQDCEKEYGVACIVFAVRDEIRVHYEIAD